jgi:hypothetical protein
VKYGLKYGPEYVTRLKRGVERNLPIKHRFICMTDRRVEGVDCIPLNNHYPTWWSKIGLFEPGLFAGDTLYLDLDVIIRDSLLPLVALLYQSPGLWARDDFSYSMRNPKHGLSPDQKKLLGGDGCVNSSVMLWKGYVGKDVWEKFHPSVMDVMHGDQNHISHVLRGRLQFIPDHLVSSYKYHVLRGLPAGNICVMHGSPKPHQLHRADPLRVCWES